MRYFTANQTFDVRTVVNDRVKAGQIYLVYAETADTVSLLVNLYEAKLERASLTDRGIFTEFSESEAQHVDAAANLMKERRRELEAAKRESAVKLARLERTRLVVTELTTSAEFCGVKPQAEEPVNCFLARVESESRDAHAAIGAAEARLGESEAAFYRLEVLNDMIWKARQVGKLPYPDDVATAD